MENFRNTFVATADDGDFHDELGLIIGFRHERATVASPSPSMPPQSSRRVAAVRKRGETEPVIPSFESFVTLEMFARNRNVLRGLRDISNCMATLMFNQL